MAKRGSKKRRDRRRQQAAQSVGGGLTQPASVSRRSVVVRAPAPDLPARRVSDLAPSAMPTARRVSQPFKSLNVTVDPAPASKGRAKPAAPRAKLAPIASAWRNAAAKLRAFSRKPDASQARPDLPTCKERPEPPQHKAGAGSASAVVRAAVAPTFRPWCK